MNKRDKVSICLKSGWRSKRKKNQTQEKSPKQLSQLREGGLGGGMGGLLDGWTADRHVWMSSDHQSSTVREKDEPEWETKVGAWSLIPKTAVCSRGGGVNGSWEMGALSWPVTSSDLCNINSILSGLSCFRAPQQSLRFDLLPSAPELFASAKKPANLHAVLPVCGMRVIRYSRGVDHRKKQKATFF